MQMVCGVCKVIISETPCEICGSQYMKIKKLRAFRVNNQLIAAYDPPETENYEEVSLLEEIPYPIDIFPEIQKFLKKYDIRTADFDGLYLSLKMRQKAPPPDFPPPDFPPPNFPPPDFIEPTSNTYYYKFPQYEKKFKALFPSGIVMLINNDKLIACVADILPKKPGPVSLTKEEIA